MSEKLRCWPDCLARVDSLDVPRLHGITVRVIQGSFSGTLLYGMYAWAVELRSPTYGLDANGQHGTGRLIAIPDCKLTPITPPPGTKIEDIPTDMPLPQPEKVLA